MKRIDDDLLREMASLLSEDEAAEMAIPSYLHRNPAMRAMAWGRVAVLARRLRVHARARRLDRVLDFGCGSGVLLSDAAAIAEDVVGVDLVPRAAELLVQRRNLSNVRILSPERMSKLEPGSVDVVIAGEVLEHVEPLEPTARALGELLRPDGVFLVSLPTENALYQLGRRWAGFSGHYHHDNAASIDRKLCSLGFVRRHKQQLPLPGPLAIYWVSEYAAPPQ